MQQGHLIDECMFIAAPAKPADGFTRIRRAENTEAQTLD